MPQLGSADPATFRVSARGSFADLTDEEPETGEVASRVLQGRSMSERARQAS